MIIIYKAYRPATLKSGPKSLFSYNRPTTRLSYDAQSGAVSLGDLGAFSAPPYDVLISFLTYHRTLAIFRSAKSNVLSLEL